MEQAEISCQAGVNQAEPGPLAVLAAGGERYLDPGGARPQPEARVGPAPREDQADRPIDDDVLPLAELAGGDLEPEAAAWPRLQIGRDTDPADQLPGSVNISNTCSAGAGRISSWITESPSITAGPPLARCQLRAQAGEPAAPELI